MRPFQGQPNVGAAFPGALPPATQSIPFRDSQARRGRRRLPPFESRRKGRTLGKGWLGRTGRGLTSVVSLCASLTRTHLSCTICRSRDSSFASSASETGKACGTRPRRDGLLRTSVTYSRYHSVRRYDHPISRTSARTYCSTSETFRSMSESLFMVGLLNRGSRGHAEHAPALRCLLLSAYCPLFSYEHPLVDPQFKHL
jgi:hypothetical protein